MSGTILVTGGAGYVGSHTVLSLLEDQDIAPQIVVVDNLKNAHRVEGERKPESIRVIEEMTGQSIHFYDSDIRDAEALDKIFRRHHVNCVIHFAAMKAVSESVEKPLDYYQANVSGTCMLLEVMKAYGVYQLVYSSSCTVYGEPERLPLDEQHPTGRNLSSPYGRSKYFCEEIMKDLCASDKKWTVISLRYFNPVGAHPSGRIGEHPNGRPNNLMPVIAQVAVGRLQAVQVYGANYPTDDGTGVRDYVHVYDLAAGHTRALRLLEKDKMKGFHAINLGTGTGYSVLDVVKAFEAASGKRVPVHVVGRRAGDVAVNYADVGLAARLLGWRATRSLADMCADTWRWQQAHPRGYRP